MSEKTKIDIGQLAIELAGVASMFSPANGATIRALVGIGIRLNGRIRAIRDQTAESQAALWDELEADYEKSAADLRASIAASRAKPSP